MSDFRERARGTRDVFVPLPHPPGHAQADFGECVAAIGGVRMKPPVFRFDPPQSDACFLKAYAAETTEAFPDGHQILRLSEVYDETRMASAALEAIRLGAIGFDAVKQIAHTRAERRPARLDLSASPFLPPARVTTTRPADCLARLSGTAA